MLEYIQRNTKFRDARMNHKNRAQFCTGVFKHHQEHKSIYITMNRGKRQRQAHVKKGAFALKRKTKDVTLTQIY